MAISTYKEDGKEFYHVYVQARGKEDGGLRVQKRRKSKLFLKLKRLKKFFSKQLLRRLQNLKAGV